MNISGVRPYAGFYDYNSIRASELRGQQIVQTEEDNLVEQRQEEQQKQESAQVAVTPEQKYTSYDYAQNYKAGETFALKGADSDIADLDMMKAISDLDKDQIFRQYQYFVGDREGAVTRSQNPSVRSSENFSL
jgi:F420-dependent methylenetetrahydromethanopterin dehydrogenase